MSRRQTDVRTLIEIPLGNAACPTRVEEWKWVGFDATEAAASGVDVGRLGLHPLVVDPTLRTALDWFVEETTSSEDFAEVHEALKKLRGNIDKLPARLFYLDSPDEPYSLAEVLVAMGKHALAWHASPDTVVERKLHAPHVEEILQEAVALRELLTAATKRDGKGAELLRLPQGEIRHRMEKRGEALPDRL